MIEVKNLTKFYGPRQAVRNLSFQVGKGEVVGFLGPNGAGKTTTMNVLTGILPATDGSVRLCGFDVFENPLEVKKSIGYLPENPPLYQDMIVEDFLEFSAKIRRVEVPNIPKAIDHVVAKCGLGKVRGRIIEKLSKGYKQRVGLAQALIHNPDILILDEPTIGLDPIQIIEIRRLIKDLTSSHTIILSSHILPEITEICQRVIIIHQGEIVAEDSLAALNSTMRKNERLQLTVRQGGNGIQDKLSMLDNVLAVRIVTEKQFAIECKSNCHLQDEIARLALANQWGIVELKPISLTLEEIFLNLTTKEAGVKA
ncbi:MAG: ABC transporter ATP-binding protein [Nitrospinales bacterium]